MSMTVDEINALLRDVDSDELRAYERALAADERKGVRQAIAAARRRVEAELAEEARIRELYAFQSSLAGEGGGFIVGLDEVGRGAVAGPLAVGAVVLPEQPPIAGLNDSKQLTPARRADLAGQIEQVALACAVEFVQPGDIDRLGMAASLRRAFSSALARIDEACPGIQVVLLDGNPLHLDEREVNVIKGDAKCASIAAASILAKVRRDELMVRMAPRYPEYGFDENKGYASERHVAAIKEHGLSDVHRATFCRSFMQETLF